MLLAFIVGIAMSYPDILYKDLGSQTLPMYIMAGIAGCVTCMGSLFYLKAYQTAEARILAPIQYTQMIWGSILGFMLFAEYPSINVIIGATIVIVANVINIKE